MCAFRQTSARRLGKSLERSYKQIKNFNSYVPTTSFSNCHCLLHALYVPVSQTHTRVSDGLLTTSPYTTRQLTVVPIAYYAQLETSTVVTWVGGIASHWWYGAVVRMQRVEWGAVRSAVPGRSQEAVGHGLRNVSSFLRARRSVYDL